MASRCTPLQRVIRLATLPFGIRPSVFDLRRSVVDLWPLAFRLAPFAVCVICGVGVGDSVGGDAGVFGVLLAGGGKRNKESEGAGSQKERSQ